LTALETAVEQILKAQSATKKPLAIVLAGHNGSGKSTMWRKTLSGQLQIPLINADRMMLSILPEADSSRALDDWARLLRDTDQNWMRVSQNGVQAFVGHAMQSKVPFAMETVFSHWRKRPDGSIDSKIDLIRDMQVAGYFVLLIFVGLTDVDLSILRVQTRVAENGHAVPIERLLQRFPRTQHANLKPLKSPMLQSLPITVGIKQWLLRCVGFNSRISNCLICVPKTKLYQARF
jgi:predicted ABC-type ATPase